MCKKARLNSWSKLQQGIHSVQDMNNFRKIIETNNKLTLGTPIKETGSYTDPGEETISYLISWALKCG